MPSTIATPLYMHAHTCVQMHMYMSAYGGQRSTSDATHLYFLFDKSYFLHEVCQVQWLATEAQEFPALYLPTLELAWAIFFLD